MAYSDDRPADWTSYDRVATAADDMRHLLSMHSAREDLRNALGPSNYARAFEYLDCIQENLKRMGRLALTWARPEIQAIADGVDNDSDTINTRWNLVEKAQP